MPGQSRTEAAWVWEGREERGEGVEQTVAQSKIPRINTMHLGSFVHCHGAFPHLHFAPCMLCPLWACVLPRRMCRAQSLTKALPTAVYAQAKPAAAHRMRRHCPLPPRSSRCVCHARPLFRSLPPRIIAFAPLSYLRLLAPMVVTVRRGMHCTAPVTTLHNARQRKDGGPTRTRATRVKERSDRSARAGEGNLRGCAGNGCSRRLR